MSIEKKVSLFGISLKSINYSIIEQDEHWNPNGDGEYYARISLNSVQGGTSLKDQMIHNDAAFLPIICPSTIVLNRLETYEKCCRKGLYILNIDSRDTRNYELLVLDEERQEVHIQILVM